MLFHRTNLQRRTLTFGSAAIALLLAASATEARPTGPGPQDRTITIAVRHLMERGHLSKQPINDTMSQRCLETFLKTLDPAKLYFYQSDVDEFTANRTRIDDFFRQGDIQFAHTVFSRFLARIEERTQTALAWIDAEHDFTLEERIVTDRDSLTYPRTPEEASERWRKRIKLELLVKLAESIDNDEEEIAENDPPAEEELSPEEQLEESRAKLRKRYESRRKRWDQTSNDELLELYLTAMTSGFDPHSSYMSPTTLENFNIQMRLELDGIGASLRAEDGYTEVHDVIAGGAADQHGKLKKGDQIVGVAQGSDGPLEDIVDMKLNDVVKLIRGKRGTIVRLQVKPVDNPKDLVEYVITRDRIELKNQEARSTIIDWGQKPNGSPYRLGVIHLPSFYMDMDGARLGLPDYKSTTRDVRRLLEGFEREGAQGRAIDAVVVDLRFNGGGSLTEAVNMTGMFIDQGPVVQVKGTDGRTVPYNDETPGMAWDGPLVVLTNKFSASASEIFAGAIQDYGRGLVVGDESTHGKGTVQQLFDIGNKIFRIGNRPNLGALKLTIQQFYRPGGDSTQNRGVLADVTIPSLTDHLEGIAEAEMDYALEFDRVNKLRFEDLGMMSNDLARELQNLSDTRTGDSEDFAKDRRQIDRYITQKDRDSVTLNLAEYLAEREELDTEKEKEEIGEELSDSDRPVFDLERHYNKEALSIVADYLRLLRENKLAQVR